MSQNLAASIHNRVSTLCQAYVKTYHPSVWTKLREKAETEYRDHARRRNTKHDLDLALQIEVIEAPKSENNSTKYLVDKYWSDVVVSPTSEDDREENI